MSLNQIKVNNLKADDLVGVGDSYNSDLSIEDANGYVLCEFSDGDIKTKNFDSRDVHNTTTVKNNRFDVDMSIVDTSQNSICDFFDGHIRTKNFDSTKISHIETNYYSEDFSIADVSGNRIVSFEDGHIHTKNFDSDNIDIPDIPDYFRVSRFNGKRLAIIGDSISTYSGTMPSGYAIYYPQGDVNSVLKMWWYKVCQKLGMTYTNTSWSGSRVSGAPKGTTATAGCSDKRIQDVGRNGNPDIIICYISCNDWGNAPVVPIGTWKTSDPIIDDSQYSSSDTINELRAAYALMIYKLVKAYPSAKIFCCTNLDDNLRDRTYGWPSNNTAGVSTYEWNLNVIEVAEALGARVIDLHACGLNYMNLPSYCVDSGLHPNAAGHQIMADFITAQLIANY